MIVIVYERYTKVIMEHTKKHIIITHKDVREKTLFLNKILIT